MIDGAIVCTEQDEHIYHEMIVHVPMQTRPHARRALVIGGGDGGAARELLAIRARSREVVAVELDAAVVSACRQHFPALAPAFDDPRLSLHIADGLTTISKPFLPDPSIVAIVDVADPLRRIPATLFRTLLPAGSRESLRPDGVMVAQTEPPAL